MIDFRETPTFKYQTAEWNARFQKSLLYLGFPSYRYIDKKWIMWIKEIISIYNRRKLCKHVATLMSQIEGFHKYRSTLDGRDLAKLLSEDAEKMKEYIGDVSIDKNNGLFEAKGTDLRTKEFINKYNSLMSQYALSKKYNLPPSFGP
jgi:hypothetical protein